MSDAVHAFWQSTEPRTGIDTLTEREAAQIVTLRVTRKASYREIKQTLCVGTGKVQRVLKACGLAGIEWSRRPGRARTRRSSTLTEREAAQIVTLRVTRKASINDIRAETGCGVSKITRVLKACGLEGPDWHRDNGFRHARPCPIQFKKTTVAPGVAATCFCAWCDRGKCLGLTDEERVDVVSAFDAWAEKKREEHERYTVEAERFAKRKHVAAYGRYNLQKVG